MGRGTSLLFFAEGGLRTKRVLITGGLGTIASYVGTYFESLGYDVVDLDITMRDDTDYIRADVVSFEDMYKAFKAVEPDVVIHTAAEVGRMVGESYPQKMITVNNLGTLNVVRLCVDFDSILVNFSTSEVYGHLADEKVLEEADVITGSPFMTTNIYAMTKLFSEAIVKHYVENYDLQAVSVRPFMIYAPNEFPSRYRSAMINFVHNARLGRKLTVHKGSVRAWCFISDFAEGLRLVMEKPFLGSYEAFNIGSDEYHTAEEVARTVIEACHGKESQIEFVDAPRKFFTYSKRFSIEKLKKLGYLPKVSLKEGVEKVVRWQNENCPRDT